MHEVQRQGSLQIWTNSLIRPWHADHAGLILSTIKVESIEHYAGVTGVLKSISAKFSQQNLVLVDMPKFMGEGGEGGPVDHHSLVVLF